MTIQRAYKTANGLYGPWEEVTEEEFLRRTEWSGEYKKGLALQALCDSAVDGLFLETRYAFFRLVSETGKVVLQEHESGPVSLRPRRVPLSPPLRDSSGGGFSLEGVAPAPPFHPSWGRR